MTTKNKTLTESITVARGTIKDLIKERFGIEEDVPPLRREDYLRSSGFPMVCPREEVICTLSGKVRKNRISPDLHLIFEHGHGLHSRLQDNILPAIGVMRGKWICNGCGVMQGGVEAGAPEDWSRPIEEWAIPYPDECEDCESTSFRFHEIDLISEEYQITGHCDGFLELPGAPGLGILEGKSIGPGWTVVDAPKLDHVIQLHIYMWLTGLQWGVILYWQKGENGVHAFIEHIVERDEDTIDSIKTQLKSVWDGIDTGKLPERICSTQACPRAKECSSAKECFKLEDHYE